MYYNITNAIGTEVTLDNGTILVCGTCYATKTKAPKDGDVLYAFSKAENPVDGLVWRFDGQAILDYAMFCKTHIHNIAGLNVDDFDKTITELSALFVLAWKSEKINIQAEIRPSKDSKKAVKQAQRVTDIAEIERKFADGDIDAAEFGKLAMALAAQM
jgi:hypothetical protein